LVGEEEVIRAHGHLADLHGLAERVHTPRADDVGGRGIATGDREPELTDEVGGAGAAVHHMAGDATQVQVSAESSPMCASVGECPLTPSTAARIAEHRHAFERLV
jgi:hypothetical protein